MAIPEGFFLRQEFLSLLVDLALEVLALLDERRELAGNVVDQALLNHRVNDTTALSSGVEVAAKESAALLIGLALASGRGGGGRRGRGRRCGGGSSAIGLC